MSLTYLRSDYGDSSEYTDEEWEGISEVDYEEYEETYSWLHYIFEDLDDDAHPIIITVVSSHDENGRVYKNFSHVLTGVFTTLNEIGNQERWFICGEFAVNLESMLETMEVLTKAS